MKFQGSGTVLVIDDDEMVRNAIAHMLEHLGYEVFQSKNGAEGLDVIKRRPIDLVLLDLSMPGMSGRELLERLRAIKPEQRVVLLTGYTPDGKFEGVSEILQKPLRMEELGRVVRKAMKEDS